VSSPEVYHRLERLLAMDPTWSEGASLEVFWRVLYIAASRRLEQAIEDTAAANLRAEIAEYELAQTRGEVEPGRWDRFGGALRELGSAVAGLFTRR
jgi:hypothetical protein